MSNAGQSRLRLPKVALLNVNYLKVLAKIAAVFLSVGSYLTSFLGACLYVSDNIPVAFLLSTGFQIGVFVFSHGVPKVNDPRREKISRLLRLGAFVPCLAFSAYMSTLGTYSVLRPSLEAGEERSVARGKLSAAAFAQNKLATSALGYINEQASALEPLIEAQKRRLQTTRRPTTRIVAQRALDKLNAKLADLNRAREVITDIGHSGESIPESTVDAYKRIDEANVKTSSILAAMPAEFRKENQLTPPEAEPARAEDIQGSFVHELRRGAAAAFYCLAIALLLDLTSILIIRSVIPIPTLPERIRRTRRYFHEVRAARSEPVDVFRQQIRLRVINYPDLSVNLDLVSEVADLFLSDLEPHFGHVEERISAEIGQPVEIRSLSSSTGMELFPDMPLKSQLDADNTIHLLTERVNEKAEKT